MKWVRVKVQKETWWLLSNLYVDQIPWISSIEDIFMTMRYKFRIGNIITYIHEYRERGEKKRNHQINKISFEISIMLLFTIDVSFVFFLIIVLDHPSHRNGIESSMSRQTIERGKTREEKDMLEDQLKFLRFFNRKMLRCHSLWSSHSFTGFNSDFSLVAALDYIQKKRILSTLEKKRVEQDEDLPWIKLIERMKRNCAKAKSKESFVFYFVELFILDNQLDEEMNFIFASRVKYLHDDSHVFTLVLVLLVGLVRPSTEIIQVIREC